MDPNYNLYQDPNILSICKESSLTNGKNRAKRHTKSFTKERSVRKVERIFLPTHPSFSSMDESGLVQGRFWKVSGSQLTRLRVQALCTRWVFELRRSFEGGFVMRVGGDIPLTGERSGLWNVYRLGMVCLKKMFVVPCN